MNAFGKRLLWIGWLAFWSAGFGQAQWATLRGRVVDAADARPMGGVNVILDGADGRVGTATDTDGAFVLTRIRPGRYVLTVSFIGYRVHTDTLTFAFDEQRRLNVSLQAEEAELEEVVVESEQRTSRDRVAGLETVRPSSLARVPMPDVTYDLAGYLLTVPGFVTPGDQGGQLFVRGGTPTQNLVLLDGMTVYQPFHIIGFYSAFPADIVSYADVYAGGFGARFGGRISSVIDVVTRNGNKQRVVGAASMAPFLSSVRLEVPLKPGRASLLASVRESVIERVAPDLLGRELPFRFGDQFFKFHAFLNRTSSFSATALRTFDEGNISAATGDRNRRRSTWRNEAYGARYIYLPEEYPVMTQVAAYVSRLESRYRLTPEDERHTSVDGFNGELIFLYLLGDTRINFGIFGSTNTFDFDLGGQTSQGTDVNVSSGGAYFDVRLDLNDRLRLEPGVRLQTFTNGVGRTLDPRLRARWLPGGPESKQQFSLAWGQYHQQIIGLNNEQDVTDVFTVWASSPPSRSVPSATHIILGWQRRVLPWVEFSAEGYYKTLHDLAFPEFGNALDRIESFTRVDGTARGLDLRLEMNRLWLFAGLNYSLARVEYERDVPLPGDGTQVVRERFAPPHDRRHQFNALLQLSRGAYRLNVRWQFGSGLPFTQINGYYQSLSVDGPDDAAFHTRGGETLVSRGAPYRAALPAYHRLDLSVQREFRFERVAATLQAGVINAYDRSNIFEYNFFSGERVDQLPLIPSVGLKVEVR